MKILNRILACTLAGALILSAACTEEEVLTPSDESLIIAPTFPESALGNQAKALYEKYGVELVFEGENLQQEAFSNFLESLQSSIQPPITQASEEDITMAITVLDKWFASLPEGFISEQGKKTFLVGTLEPGGWDAYDGFTYDSYAFYYYQFVTAIDDFIISDNTEEVLYQTDLVYNMAEMIGQSYAYGKIQELEKFQFISQAYYKDWPAYAESGLMAGGFLSSEGQRSYAKDFGVFVAEIMTNTREEMMAKYEGYAFIEQKYELVIDSFKRQGWDLQDIGNKYSSSRATFQSVPE
ncbi:hypothetical protein V6R21_15830 [Limibacter armeniacum]|uniref:hypothetical protein n=1 Tax=Limibacter armeniacum TaxID=466084 RepID=UPI002FE51B78